jgi:RNA polymerase sigma-70 factor (ECF subfamily)
LERGHGVQQKPEAWLLRVAPNRIIDVARRKQGRQDSERFLQQIAEEAQTVAATHEHLPDERETFRRLRAAGVDAAARTPLMLQTALGVDAARIASPFLISPAAMGQRLVCDKKQNPRTVGHSRRTAVGISIPKIISCA